MLELPDVLQSSALASFLCENKLQSAGAVALLSYFAYVSCRSRSKSLPLPPGPKPQPLLGNMLQIPSVGSWKVYNEWRKQYGDVIYMSALGQRILVINSHEAAHELLVTRAPNYSDRPWTPVIDLIHFNWAFSMYSLGLKWREHRRMFHRALNYTQIHRYHTLMEQEMQKFLPRLLADPKDHRDLLRYLFATIIMRVSYGSEDYEYNKTLAHSAETVIQGFMKYTDPGRLLVNIIHCLRYVPAWVPGAGWQRELADVARHSDMVTANPYNGAKERVRNGTQSDYSALAVQFMETLPNESDPEYAEREEAARHVAAVAYAAGADTSVSLAQAIVLALAMNPQVQRRAQEELDTVIGSGRLPTTAEVLSLPYLTAIVKEAARWHTVLPLGVAHYSRDDDVYKGYHIPAKTLILPNQWAIMHDPAHFDSPFEFKPERYLKDGKIDPTVLDPDAAAFGFGRRICPGRHFSNDSLQLMVATLLTCFNIEQSLDKDGNVIPLVYDVPQGIPISAPCPYECEFVPRSQQHIDLIRSFAQ